MKLAQDRDIALSIFRLANVYGLDKLSNRMGLVEAALKKKEIFLTVNSESRKQYGTYNDYAYYILHSLRNLHGKPNNFIVQNIFSDHLYSIGDILRVTAPHNTYGDDRLVHAPGDSSIIETVILTSIHPVAKYNFKWQSLEDYVGGVDS
jgi:nucleoside-diphosphate-sugar epimerase